MRLIELKNILQIDSGAPMPLVLSNDNNLYIIFYETDNNKINTKINEEDSIVVVQFNYYSQYKFGLPNDETLSGHPYYPLGLEWYSFYEVKDSDWIEQLIQIDKVHENFNESNWELQKHYILTFHDNTFECIAESFDVQGNLKGTMYEQACTILNKILS